MNNPGHRAEPLVASARWSHLSRTIRSAQEVPHPAEQFVLRKGVAAVHAPLSRAPRQAWNIRHLVSWPRERAEETVDANGAW